MRGSGYSGLGYLGDGSVGKLLKWLWIGLDIILWVILPATTALVRGFAWGFIWRFVRGFNW